jgi:ribulose kinase
VKGSVHPAYTGIEAGLSATGDIFSAIAQRAGKSVAERWRWNVWSASHCSQESANQHSPDRQPLVEAKATQAHGLGFAAVSLFNRRATLACMPL